MPNTHALADGARHARPLPLPLPQHGLALPARDAGFVDLQDAYRSRGGVARGESLAQRMSLLGPGGYVDLARRIVAGQLFSFQWHENFWLPMFQFDPLLLTPLEAPRRVLAELRGLDGWLVAHWYVTARHDLQGHTPLDRLDTDLPAVLAAARSTRARTSPPRSAWPA